MTARPAACPNCGAPVTFRFAQAVQVSCDYCRGVLVRDDLDLRLVGVESAIPEDASPIQLGTTGVWRGKPFTVVGRLAYRSARAAWSEWHLDLGGTSAWLSDAQLEYAVTRRIETPDGLAMDKLWAGRDRRIDGVDFGITAVYEAQYVGMAGDLPFTYQPSGPLAFVDLRGRTTPAFATVDGSEDPPLVFVGEFVAARDLRLTGLREFEGWS